MVTVFLEDTQLRAELLAVSMFRNAVHNLSHVGSCFGEHGVDVVEAEHHRENDQHLHIEKKTHDLHRANSRLCQNFPNTRRLPLPSRWESETWRASASPSHPHSAAAVNSDNNISTDPNASTVTALLSPT